MNDLPARVTAIAGALTAVGALIVVPGAAAMAIRLNRVELPADLGVVVSLPGEFLLAFGLGYVVGPLLLVVALALAVTWVPGPRNCMTPALRYWRLRGFTQTLLLSWLLLTGFVLLAGLGLPIAGPR
jgi:hypothetical protein